MSEQAHTHDDQLAAKQALEDAKAAKIRANQLQSRGRLWLCLAAYFHWIPLTLLEWLLDLSLPFAVYILWSLPVGYLLLKRNYQHPVRQRGVFAADSFITFFTFGTSAAGLLLWPVGWSLPEEPGASLSVVTMVAYLAISLLATWAIVRFARRKTQ